MTLATTSPKIVYTGDAVTVNFPVPFQFFVAAELEVIERVIASGLESVKALSTDYTVSGGNGATGTVTALAAPAATVEWHIRRKTSEEQADKIIEGGALPARTVEQRLDRAFALIQELGEKLSRAISFPRTDSAALSAELAGSVARANKALLFDATGKLLAGTLATSGAVVLPLQVSDGGTGGATAAAARANLAVAGLADANVLTAVNTVRSVDAGAGEIVAWDLDRASASPAAGDLLMALRWLMRDAGGGTDVAAKLVAKLLDPTAASEDAELRFATMLAGAFADRLALGAGLYTAGATGGDKGADTVNAQDVHVRGNPLGKIAVVSEAGAAPGLTADNLAQIIKLTNAGAVTITLPTIASVGNGWRVTLLNEAGGDVTVNTGAGADQFQGGTATTLKIQNAAGRNRLEIWTDGAKWLTSERRFVSAAQTITSGGLITLAHGLGAMPRKTGVRLKNVTAEGGWVANDEIYFSPANQDNGTNARGTAIYADATNLNARYGSDAGNSFTVLNKTTGARVVITNANWNVIFEAEY